MIASSMEASINFITSLSLDDDPPAAVVNQQVQHLKLIISRSTTSLTDCTRGMEILRDCDAFTTAQKTDIRKSIQAAASVGSVASTRSVVTTKGQEHFHYEKYMDNELWEYMKSSEPMSAKIDKLTTHLIDVTGLHYPKETTSASIVAIPIAFHVDGDPCPVQAYRWVLDFKAEVIRKRGLPHHGVLGPAIYTHDIDEFMAGHPDRYPLDAQPVASHIPAARLDRVRHFVSARKTNKHVRDSFASASSILHTTPQSSPPPMAMSRVGNMDVNNLAQLGMQALMNMQYQQAHRSTDPSDVGINIFAKNAGASTRRPKSMPALARCASIADATIDDVDMAPGSSSHNADVPTLPPVEADGSSAIVLASSGKRPRPSDDEFDDIDNMIEQCKAGKLKKAAPQAKPKAAPKATPKASAKAASKSSVMTDEVVYTTSKPPMPKVGTSVSFTYRGCRVRTDLVQHAWRVWPKPSTHKYDKKFTYDKSVPYAAAWKAMLQYCEKPVIPKGSKAFK